MFYVLQMNTDLVQMNHLKTMFSITGIKGGKIMKRLFILLTAGILAASCEKAAESDNGIELISFRSSILTKTSLNGKQVLWSVNDTISVFADSQNNPFTTEDNGSEAVFTGSATAGLDKYYAFYPYQKTSTFEAGIVTFRLPIHQNSKINSFDEMTSPAFAVSESDVLEFSNVATMVKFTLAQDAGDIMAVALVGGKGEYLSGRSTVDATAAVPVAVSSHCNEVRLSAGDGNLLEKGKEYCIVVAPTELKSGMTVKFIFSDYTSATLPVPGQITLTRNIPLNLGTIKPASAVNLVKNGDLENGWTCWTKNEWNTNLDNSASNESQIGSIINGACHLRYSGGKNQWASVQQTVAVQAGSTYSFGFTGRAQTDTAAEGESAAHPTGGVTMTILPTGNNNAKKATSIKATNMNTSASGTITIPSGVSEVTVRIWKQVNHDTPCITYADDIYFIKTE